MNDNSGQITRPIKFKCGLILTLSKNYTVGQLALIEFGYCLRCKDKDHLDENLLQALKAMEDAEKERENETKKENPLSKIP